jgi:hypothetical protein
MRFASAMLARRNFGLRLLKERQELPGYDDRNPESAGTSEVLLARSSNRPNLNPHVLASHFDRKHLRSLFFPAAGAVIEADAPAVPAANNLAFLHDALAQGKAQMRAKILDGVKSALPSKQRNANAISFYGESEAIGGKVCHGRYAYPFVHVADDILRALKFARPSMRTRSQDRV